MSRAITPTAEQFCGIIPPVADILLKSSLPDPASFAAPHHACTSASSARQASKDSRATLVSMLSKV
ncbi:MAG: hypothetical protein ABIO86_08650, partial [Sphingomonas sp.]